VSTPKLAFALLTFCAMLYPLAGSTGSLAEPIGLSLGGRSIFLLDETRGLVLIPQTMNLSEYRIFATFDKSWEATDLASGDWQHGGRIFVTAVEGSFGMLMEYSGQGQFQNRWVVPATLSGVGVDEQNRRTFVTSASTGVIYYRSWDDPPTARLTSFDHAVSANTLGPLAVDALHSVIFVADQGLHQILAVDLNSKKTHEVTDLVALTSALAFDATHNKLYIADSARAKIWVISGYPKVATPHIFSSATVFRHPSALAVSSDGTIWVGDFGARTLFHLNSNGIVSTTYHLFLDN
jgi:DNA-binding beta-propeller fold protein YncE